MKNLFSKVRILFQPKVIGLVFFSFFSLEAFATPTFDGGNSNGGKIVFSGHE